ncbi:lysis protein [Serratia marcescens]|uniref:lysis protein n=1 Tax=Serratia marcescens TaxID=615 RepID=UPI000666EDD6|nr:lysis protein [Serratia marcescens]AVE48831.1 lysis protein [Serratia marcescens]MBH2978183.1 lysis protein [Serratia marcescens]MBN5328200.1 lysis protein [Serratia marcescens]MBN5351896.1 lysis protein [Serratia marcescens]MDU0858617.1 lysis protein [Serratia marcescens]
MKWLLVHWPAAATVIALGLLACFTISNQTLRHERDKLQVVNSQLTDQIDWQNSTQRVVTAIDEHRTKELNDAKNQVTNLQRDVADGTRKLQLAALCSTSGTAGMADASSPRFTDADERDYFRLRERIEITNKQIAGLQDYIQHV